MRNEEVDEEKLRAGDYCRHGNPGCFCLVGWPYERQHEACRDDEPNDRGSYCVCPPPD